MSFLPTPRKAARRLSSRHFLTGIFVTFHGAIILMHDIYETSVAAVPRLIDEMRGSGYEFVTVSELAREHGATLENGVAYRGL